MAADQIPGESLSDYRIRKLEENYEVLDEKLDTMISGLADVKHVQNDLVLASKSKASSASTLRITIIGGLVVAAGGTVITVVVALVNAYIHLSNAGVTP